MVTPASTCALGSFNSRSREGSDGEPLPAEPISSKFQFTLPRGERLILDPCLLRFRVSIHAPARGATQVSRDAGVRLGSFNSRSREGSDSVCSFSLLAVVGVSIHAPARGATRQC